jgi:hypothetical protein
MLAQGQGACSNKNAPDGSAMAGEISGRFGRTR